MVTPKDILNEDIEAMDHVMKQLNLTRDGVWASQLIWLIAKAVRDLLVIQRKGVDTLRGSERMPAFGKRNDRCRLVSWARQLFRKM